MYMILMCFVLFMCTLTGCSYVDFVDMSDGECDVVLDGCDEPTFSFMWYGLSATNTYCGILWAVFS